MIATNDHNETKFLTINYDLWWNYMTLILEAALLLSYSMSSRYSFF